MLFTLADRLPGDIGASIKSVELTDQDGMNLIIVDGPPTGAAEGALIALLAILVGGIPAGVVGIALEARTRRRGISWPDGYSRFFYAGLIFQLCSLLLALLICAFFLGEIPALAAFVVAVNVACGVLGLPSWRYLERAALVRLRELGT